MSLRTSRSKVSLIATVVILMIPGTSSCSSDAVSSGSRSIGTTADQQYLFGNLAAQREAGNARIVARNLTEYLPNQLFSVDGAEVESESASVIRGRVVDVFGAHGYYVPGAGPEADAPSGTGVAFDDPRAQWRIYDVAVEVEDFVGAATPKVVHLGISLDGPDTGSLMRGLNSLGDVVVVLEGQGFFKFNRDLHYVDGFNTLLGRVAADGSIGFPALRDAEAEFIGALTTWDAVETEFNRKKNVIAVDVVGSRPADSTSR